MDAAAVTVGGGSCSADQRCSVARGLRPCIWRYWTAKPESVDDLIDVA